MISTAVQRRRGRPQIAGTLPHEVMLVAYLLGAILIMLGLIADRVH
jgi:hypothetical protein